MYVYMSVYWKSCSCNSHNNQTFLFSRASEFFISMFRACRQFIFCTSLPTLSPPLPLYFVTLFLQASVKDLFTATKLKTCFIGQELVRRRGGGGR